MNTLLIAGGRLIDPANGRDGNFDLLISNGRIAKVDRQVRRAKPEGRLWLLTCVTLVAVRFEKRDHQPTVANRILLNDGIVRHDGSRNQSENKP